MRLYHRASPLRRQRNLAPGDLNSKNRYDFSLRFVASPVAAPDLIVVPTAKNGPVVAVKPDANGMIAAGSPFEQWRMPHDTPDVPSPLIHDGLVYLCSERGVLSCLDAKTGKPLYQQRLHSARYRAFPVYADGKIYCTARDGTVTVVKAGPESSLWRSVHCPIRSLLRRRFPMDGFLRGLEAACMPSARERSEISSVGQRRGMPEMGRRTRQHQLGCAACSIDKEPRPLIRLYSGAHLPEQAFAIFRLRRVFPPQSQRARSMKRVLFSWLLLSLLLVALFGRLRLRCLGRVVTKHK